MLHPSNSRHVRSRRKGWPIAARLRRFGVAPVAWVLLCIVLLPACDSAPSSSWNLDALDVLGQATCSLLQNQIHDSVAKDAIPALTNPTLVNADEADYLNDDDRVIGLEIGDQTIAVPHNILWHHEIVNFDSADPPLAVTYCPLTGSGIAFDRSDLGGAAFGVSGLLFQNNLIMYDRTSNESLWPQMARGARCGPADGLALFTYPVLEMTWQGWRALHPATKVLSSDTRYNRNYTENPYGNYDEPANDLLLFPMALDQRRLPKERVLGLPLGRGGVAFPFGALDDGEAMRVVPITYGTQPIVVFWHRAFEAAMAYQVPLDLAAQTFEVRGGQIFDAETGSQWRIDGRAVAGPLRGRRLQPVRDAYVAFWFAWAAFQPKTELWTGE